MIHFFGALLLIAASTSFGVLQTLELKKRPRELLALIQALLLVKHDLLARALPLPTAMIHAAVQCDPCCRLFFVHLSDRLGDTEQTFSDLWRAELICFPRLGKQARDALEELGRHLGKYDAQSQAEAIDVCINVLHQSADLAAERVKQYGKLYTGLGMTLGAMLAVALY